MIILHITRRQSSHFKPCLPVEVDKPIDLKMNSCFVASRLLFARAVIEVSSSNNLFQYTIVLPWMELTEKTADMIKLWCAAQLFTATTGLISFA